MTATPETTANTTTDNDELPPYRRSDLQDLITKAYNEEINDDEFYRGIDRIINSWKNQFAQPEFPNGWRVAKRRPTQTK